MKTKTVRKLEYQGKPSVECIPILTKVGSDSDSLAFVKTQRDQYRKSLSKAREEAEDDMDDVNQQADEARKKERKTRREGKKKLRECSKKWEETSEKLE